MGVLLAHPEVVDTQSGDRHCVAGMKIVAKWPPYTSGAADNPWFAAQIVGSGDFSATNNAGFTGPGIYYEDGSFASCAMVNSGFPYGDGDYDYIRFCPDRDNEWGKNAAQRGGGLPSLRGNDMIPEGCNDICVMRTSYCGEPWK